MSTFDQMRKYEESEDPNERLTLLLSVIASFTNSDLNELAAMLNPQPQPTLEEVLRGRLG